MAASPFSGRPSRAEEGAPAFFTLAVTLARFTLPSTKQDGLRGLIIGRQSLPAAAQKNSLAAGKPS